MTSVYIKEVHRIKEEKEVCVKKREIGLICISVRAYLKEMRSFPKCYTVYLKEMDV